MAAMTRLTGHVKNRFIGQINRSTGKKMFGGGVKRDWLVKLVPRKRNIAFEINYSA